MSRPDTNTTNTETITENREWKSFRVSLSYGYLLPSSRSHRGRLSHWWNSEHCLDNFPSVVVKQNSSSCVKIPTQLDEFCFGHTKSLIIEILKIRKQGKNNYFSREFKRSQENSKNLFRIFTKFQLQFCLSGIWWVSLFSLSLVSLLNIDFTWHFSFLWPSPVFIVMKIN